MVLWLILCCIIKLHLKEMMLSLSSLKGAVQSLLALCRARRHLYMTIQSNEICLFINKFQFEFVFAQ